MFYDTFEIIDPKMGNTPFFISSHDRKILWSKLSIFTLYSVYLKSLIILSLTTSQRKTKYNILAHSLYFKHYPHRSDEYDRLSFRGKYRQFYTYFSYIKNKVHKSRDYGLFEKSIIDPIWTFSLVISNNFYYIPTLHDNRFLTFLSFFALSF